MKIRRGDKWGEPKPKGGKSTNSKRFQKPEGVGELQKGRDKSVG